MALIVREVAFGFASGELADAWVAAHEPAGLVVGPVSWQLVMHRPGSTSVRLLQGFDSAEVAGDWQTAVLPELGTADDMTVALAEAQVYVTGDPAGQEGPGRVWMPADDFP